MREGQPIWAKGCVRRRAVGEDGANPNRECAIKIGLNHKRMSQIKISNRERIAIFRSQK